MQSSLRSRRNPAIDLWKFIYCWFIVFYHICRALDGQLSAGRFGVEFFLLTAGVFFFQGLEKKMNTPPGKRIFHRWCRFLPWSVSAFVFAFVVIRVVINGDRSPAVIATRLSSDIWEALLVKMNGMNHGRGLLNSPAWTLSCMFLVEILMIELYATCKKVFVNVLLPLSLIVGFGFWRMTENGAVEDWIGFTTFGMLRTWLVYGCGYFCLKLSQWLADVPFTRAARLALTGLELLCHVFAMLVMFFADSRYWQWCTLLAFFAAVAIEKSGHSLFGAALERCSPVTGFLSQLSLCIYLTHRPVTRYFEMLYPTPDVLAGRLLPMLAAILVCALVHYGLISGLLRFWRGHRDGFRAFFVSARTEG